MRSFRPLRLEALEDRTVPTTTVVGVSSVDPSLAAPIVASQPLVPVTIVTGAVPADSGSSGAFPTGPIVPIGTPVQL